MATAIILGEPCNYSVYAQAHARTCVDLLYFFIFCSPHLKNPGFGFMFSNNINNGKSEMFIECLNKRLFHN